jgi:GTP-binding protein EngB required for normal cell division
MQFLPSFFHRKDSIIGNLLKKLAHEDANNLNHGAFNIVFIGQTGVGSSSLINMITETSQVRISTDVSPCTKTFTAYDFAFNGRNFRLIDSPGFGPSRSATSAITKSLRELDSQFGIDLVVNCLRGTRGDANAGVENYTAIRSAVSGDVPIVAVVTSLERYSERMDQWWSRNEADLKARRMVFADHACVTTLDAASTSDAKIKARIVESQKATKDLVLRSCCLDRRGTLGMAPPRRHPRW